MLKAIILASLLTLLLIWRADQGQKKLDEIGRCVQAGGYYSQLDDACYANGKFHG